MCSGITGASFQCSLAPLVNLRNDLSKTLHVFSINLIPSPTSALKMNSLRIARSALKVRPSALRCVQRRGYADVASDKIRLSLALPHQVRQLSHYILRAVAKHVAVAHTLREHQQLAENALTDFPSRPSTSPKTCTFPSAQFPTTYQKPSTPAEAQEKGRLIILIICLQCASQHSRRVW